jgi:hypothetical protein
MGTAMNGRAEYEEFVFAEASQGQLSRVLIVHFEHAVPGSGLHFRYPQLEMVRLGAHEYLHQSYPAKDWDLFTSPSMTTLLRARGLTAPANWITSRYVRAGDESLKSEVIIFYTEPAPELPASFEDLGLAGKSRDLWLPFDRRLSEAGRTTFRIIGD